MANAAATGLTLPETALRGGGCRAVPGLMQVFRDIAVVPVQRFRAQVAVGGPVWPDFAVQIAARHCRNLRPVDAAPTPVAADDRESRPCVWGGTIGRHFGHFVAEHLPRLPVSLRARPQDLYLFTLEPGLTPAGVPAHVWDLLAWHGLPPAQVRLIIRPLLVAELRVAAQGEMLPATAPAPGYLALIEARAGQVRAVPNAVLYVTRAGAVAAGAGGHAGEPYLVSLLERLGVAVLDPATTDIAGQMALYAGAKCLIFAEGSAVHGRQILGRMDQDIRILCRRKGRKLAQALLEPRCRQLHYHRTARATLMAYWRDGRRRHGPAVALYDQKVLLRAFAAAGVNLASHWDADAYHRAALADIAGWRAHHRPDASHRAEDETALALAGLRPQGPHHAATDKGQASPGPAPHFEGKAHGPVHPAQELENPHRQDLAAPRRSGGAEIPDLPLEP